LSDDSHGPFSVRWNSDPPRTQGAVSRAGAERIFDDLPDAIQFVMEQVPEGSRGTAWIDATAGSSLQIDEIVRRYTQPNLADKRESPAVASGVLTRLVRPGR
jgi:hypothetical protein